MNYAYIDFETTYTRLVSLSKLTLRQYLAQAAVLGMSIAMNDDEPVFFTFEQLSDDGVREDLKALAESDDWTVVAHTAAFDVRVWRHKLNLPQPKHVHCSMELAYGAWPNQPGGYGIDNLCRTMNLGLTKLGDGTKVMGMSPEMLAAYCNQDVRICRAIHQRALRRLHPKEIQIAELCNAAREMYFEIDSEKLETAHTEFVRAAQESVETAVELLGEEGAKAFGMDGTKVKSVKPHEMKRLLLSEFGFDTQSISFKKMNPTKLATAAEGVVPILRAAERANRSLSHQRRVSSFAGSTEVDVELGYHRAHTGRFSSPQPGGKGINLHNLPKRDKRLAKAIRSIFRLPDWACFVRGDFANVEYRVQGLLCGSAHVRSLFETTIGADPYAAFWLAATGRVVTKADPARQVAKAAVLGLGYGMGIQTWISTLLMALADPTFGVSLADLRKVCEDQGWGPPGDRATRGAMAKLNAPWEVASVAYHTRTLFHEIHPEFGRIARWLVTACETLNRCQNIDEAKRSLDRLYSMPQAPSRERVDLLWDDTFEGRTIRARCGKWVCPTVTWRDIDVRAFGDFGGVGLTSMTGNKGYRALTPNILIENLVQAAARNALCELQLNLREKGYEYQLSVHDETLLAVSADVSTVRKAKDDLLKASTEIGWDWAVYLDPTEVNVSRSMYEVDMGTLLPPTGTDERGKLIYPKSKAWWDALVDHPELLEALP